MLRLILNVLWLIFGGLELAVAWWIAYREFAKVRGTQGLLEAVRRSKDPTLFTVLFEDSAAMLGLIVAFAGLLAAQFLGLDWMDGAASIGIGVILALTAALLAYETKALLIGEAASRELETGVREILAGAAAVRGINELRSMHMGPREVLLALSLDFGEELSVGAVEEAIFAIELSIKKRFPEVRRLFIEVQSRAHHDQILAAEAARETP